jgi:serine O-acetyltransferase
VNIGEHNGGAPRIGNDVYIGPGAKLFGDIEIADNIVIGANAVVNKSFLTPGISIGGVPARQLRSSNTASAPTTNGSPTNTAPMVGAPISVPSGDVPLPPSVTK